MLKELFTRKRTCQAECGRALPLSEFKGGAPNCRRCVEVRLLAIKLMEQDRMNQFVSEVIDPEYWKPYNYYMNLANKQVPL